ncbi:hypothetical protein LVD17_01685 [Fulvivirga ulvae]|uniref:hypothetical protein n=1 Tax=Fulvivirga ulvae TaxID=2904245 RepID=UPI001F2D5B75|nr:hypothetical protein [Fulvivirga ulvae]UII32550.1 hypothetical protein LVD17_01685 [Fulvivirga ulvae]
MVEVFKTSVKERQEADALITLIHDTFTDVMANFDLDDCDHILRIQYNDAGIQPDQFIKLLSAAGYNAEVLPDIIPSIDHTTLSYFSKEKN